MDSDSGGGHVTDFFSIGLVPLMFASRTYGLCHVRVDFTLTEPESGDLLVRAHVYNLMVGHVVLQVPSWHPQPPHEGKTIRFKALDGPWDQLTIQTWLAHPLKRGGFAFL